jgi:hypothetical protein
MALEVGQVQKTSGGYGFNLKDSSGRRWITLAYRTDTEANDARTKIEAATANVVNATIKPAWGL